MHDARRPRGTCAARGRGPSRRSRSPNPTGPHDIAASIASTPASGSSHLPFSSWAAMNTSFDVLRPSARASALTWRNQPQFGWRPTEYRKSMLVRIDETWVIVRGVEEIGGGRHAELQGETPPCRRVVHLALPGVAGSDGRAEPVHREEGLDQPVLLVGAGPPRGGLLHPRVDEVGVAGWAWPDRRAVGRRRRRRAESGRRRRSTANRSTGDESAARGVDRRHGGAQALEAAGQRVVASVPAHRAGRRHDARALVEAAWLEMRVPPRVELHGVHAESVGFERGERGVRAWSG